MEKESEMRKPNLAPGGRRRLTVRAIAALLGSLLVFGSLAPPLALAKHEHDTEGEGTSAPGALPGLEIGVGQQPSGEETALSEESVGPEESEVEEEVPAPEVEEPEPEGVEAPPTAPTVPLPPEAAAPVPAEAPPPTSETPTTPPVEAPAYGVEESPPSYEPAPSTPPPSAEAVVQHETIVGPAPRHQASAKKSAQSTTQAAPSTAVDPEPEPAAPVAPQPLGSPAAVVPGAASDRPGSFVGRNTHLVAAGECLWSIAAAALPAGATNAQIAAEVHELWRINSDRIGTGDPNVLPVGVKLRLS